MLEEVCFAGRALGAEECLRGLPGVEKRMDTIGDFLTAIRNALAVRHREVSVPYSRLKAEVARVLLEEGYIKNYKVSGERPQEKRLIVSLKYFKGEPVIHEITRVSRPGRRHYESTDKMVKVAGGLGIAILTTSKGVMCDREAKKQNVGGEVICRIW